MEPSVNNKEENKIIVYDLSGTEALRYMKQEEKQNVIDNNNNEEIVIDVTDCETANDVMFRLTKDTKNFQPDKKEDHDKLRVNNTDHFWLKVDDKLYIKFGSYIQRDEGILSSNQKMDENNKKTELAVVTFNQDCVQLDISKYNNKEDTYNIGSNNCFHFHKNEEAKKHGQIQYENTLQHEHFCAEDTTQPLYRNNNTYLRNIGNACKIARSQLPLAVCGINVFKNKKDPSCLCGIGCCSPYGMMDEVEAMDLATDIFPLFNLKNATNENKEKIV